MQPLQPVPQPQPAAPAGEGLLQDRAEGLHRTFQMPEPQGLLGHLQHRGSIEGGGTVGGFLGIEPQLEIEEAAQSFAGHTGAATGEALQIGDGGGGGQTARQGCRPQSAQQLAQVPPGAGRQHRIAAGEGPVRPMQGRAEIPEAIASWELATPLLPPGGGITVQTHRWLSIAEIHHAARIERGGRRRRHPEVGEQALVNPPGLQAGHLGGAHIETPGSAAERACAAAALVVGLQQRHRHALPGQQGGGGEAGDATTDHHHILFGGAGGNVHAGMLARRQGSRGMGVF